jgi:hypothetical protein
MSPRRGGGRGSWGVVGGTASEHRTPSNSHRRPHYSPDALVGGRSLARRDNQLQRAIAAAGTRPRPFRRRRDSQPIGSTQCASQERCRAGRSCRRRVGFRPEGLGRVSAATRHNVGEVLRLSVGPGPRPTHAEVATQPVRPVPRSTACSECAPESRPGVASLPASVLCGTTHAHRHQLGSFTPGDTERQQRQPDALSARCPAAAG